MKTEARYINYIYNVVKKESEGLDAIYEDYIIYLIGATGFENLRAMKLLTTCGSVNGRTLYTLNEKES